MSPSESAVGLWVALELSLDTWPVNSAVTGSCLKGLSYGLEWHHSLLPLGRTSLPPCHDLQDSSSLTFLNNSHSCHLFLEHLCITQMLPVTCLTSAWGYGSSSLSRNGVHSPVTSVALLKFIVGLTDFFKKVPNAPGPLERTANLLVILLIKTRL